MYQLLHTSRPGSLDTSLVSTDYINNPRTMNAVYQLGPRLEIGKRWGKETLAGGGLNNRQFNDYVKDGPLTKFFDKPATVWTPHVLKDGSDSVGALGALNRVYLNIGLFSEEWLRHFNPLAGGKPITPIEISVARKNSAYWLATEAQTPAMALFFLKSTAPHRLKDAPGGAAHLTTDQALLRRGKIVFAERCARCHSSKAPTPARGARPRGVRGAWLSRVLGPLLGVDQDRRVQAADAADRSRRRLPRRQLPLDRGPRARHAARDQRVQPAGHQCDRREHLGQLLLEVLQGPPVGGDDHGPPSAHRGAGAVPDAGRGPRLHAPALARERLVDGAPSC